MRLGLSVRSPWGARSLMPAVLLFVGLGGLAWEVIEGGWSRLSRPRAAYVRSRLHGVAVSLNALECQRSASGLLPRMCILGVALDPRRRDWVVFGADDPSAPALPIDAVVVAFGAVRNNVDAPAVDIRPCKGSGRRQSVSYSGGIEWSVVGQWFFTFDHWMKRAALSDDVAGPALGSYWGRLLTSEKARGLGSEQEHRTARFWLSTAAFDAIEDDQCLAFQSTPMRVDVEESVAALSSPATATPAAEFAGSLTQHLESLRDTSFPEIREFAKLVAGLSWLFQVDPYHDARGWLERKPQAVATVGEVDTLERQEVLSSQSGVCRLDLSGGVFIKPAVNRSLPADPYVAQLWGCILAARPGPDVVTWAFDWIRV